MFNSYLLLSWANKDLHYSLGMSLLHKSLELHKILNKIGRSKFVTYEKICCDKKYHVCLKNRSYVCFFVLNDQNLMAHPKFGSARQKSSKYSGLTSTWYSPIWTCPTISSRQYGYILTLWSCYGTMKPSSSTSGNDPIRGRALHVSSWSAAETTTARKGWRLVFILCEQPT